VKTQFDTDDPRSMIQEFVDVEQPVKFGGEPLQDEKFVSAALLNGIEQLHLVGEFSLAQMRPDSGQEFPL
jgi:hypothetical protein